MCVAQINSWQDELLAMIRKAQSMGLVIAITYDEEELAERGYYIIDTVQFTAKGFGPYPVGSIAARERLSEFFAQRRLRRMAWN
jgi:hypothetical protein